MNDQGIIIGSMSIIALSGTVHALSKGQSPIKPIVGALGALVVLGGIATVAPQIARGLAVVGTLSVLMVYLPDILALWNGSGNSGGKAPPMRRAPPESRH